MKYLLLSTLSLFLSLSCFSQTFSWLNTAYSFNCSGDINATDIATDQLNNVYSAGIFGTGTGLSKKYRFNGDSLTAHISASDNYIVKYDALGNLLWKTSVVSKQEEGTARIDCDNSNNLFFTSQMSKGSGGTGVIKIGQSNGVDITTAQDNSYGDGLLVKYNSAGLVQWHRHFYDTGTDSISFEIEDVKTDASGDVYICGAFRGQITIGGAFTDGIGPGPIFSVGIRNVFIAKFNGATGALSWFKKAGSSQESNRALSLYIDGSNVYAYGFFEKDASNPTLIMEGTSLTTGALTNASGHFVINYSTAGVFDWVRWGYTDGSSGESQYKYSGGGRPHIDGDASGNVYILQNPRSIGTGILYSFNGSALTYARPGAGSGTANYILAKYNSAGALQFVNGEGVNDNAALYSIRGFTKSPSGGFYACFVFRNSINLNATSFTSAGGREVVISEFDVSGNIIGNTQYGDGNDDYCTGIELMPNSQLAYTGYLSNPAGGVLPTLNDPYDGLFIGICDQLTAITGVWGSAVTCFKPIISGSTSNLCESNTRAFTASPTPGTWSVQSGGGSITAAGVYTPANVSVNTTVEVVYTLSCALLLDTITFTVVPVLSQPSIISGTTPVCTGTSQTYSVTNVTGATYAWSYSGGGTATSTTNSVTFTPTSSGTLSVTATNACGTSTARTLAITVDAAAPATPSVISGTTPVCTGSSQTYTVTYVAGVTYAWSYSGGGTATSTTNSVTFTPTSSGTLSVTASNSCGTSTARTLAITVDAAAPAQPSIISGTTPVCTGSSQTYTVTSVAGVTYAWSYSGGGTATSTTNSVTFTPTSSGTLSVTATNGCGTSTARTLAITVDAAAPAQSSVISGNINVCATAETYTVTNVSGVTYTWSYSGGGTATSTTNSVTFTPTSSGTLSVTATNSCGTSAARTLVINVASGAPTQPSAISGPASVCSSSPQTYSVTNVASVTYAWSYSGGGTPTGTTNSTTFTPTSSGTLSVTATNACGTSPAQTLNIVIGTATPATPGIISGSTTVCSSSQTYGIVPVAGASTYNWSYTGSGVPSSTTSTVTFTPTSSGVLSVTATNPCGTSAAQTLSITVDVGVPAQPSTITGNTIICDNSLQTYSVTNVAGVTYTWSYSGAGSPSSTSNSVSFNPTSNGTLSVIATNSCGASTQSTINIIVDILAPVSLGIDQIICSGTAVNLTVSNNVTYTYLWSDGSNTNMYSSTPTTNQTVWVRVTNSSGCIVTDTMTITITGATSITAVNDSITVLTDRLETLNVSVNDSQTGNINIVSAPTFGVATINSNGDITYKSYIDYIGNDVLSYEICDAFCSLICDTAYVYIKVEHNVFDNPDNGNIGSWGVTPNGDGINDVLLIDGLYEYPDNQLTIYNRWGDRIYSAKPYNQDWNGSSSKEVVNGTYFFILEIEGKPEPFKGFIHLQK